MLRVSVVPAVHSPRQACLIHNNTIPITGYAAAKHACDGWMSSLRIEAKVWGIDVACVCPCWHEIDIEYFDRDLFASLPPSMQVSRWGGAFCVSDEG